MRVCHCGVKTLRSLLQITLYRCTAAAAAQNNDEKQHNGSQEALFSPHDFFLLSAIFIHSIIEKRPNQYSCFDFTIIAPYLRFSYRIPPMFGPFLLTARSASAIQAPPAGLPACGFVWFYPGRAQQ